MGSVSLSWNPNPEPDLAGYNVYHGTTPGVYGPVIGVGNTTTYTVPGLAYGQTHYFTVSAYDTAGGESPKSAEVSVTLVNPPPAAPTGLTIVSTS